MDCLTCLDGLLKIWPLSDSFALESALKNAKQRKCIEKVCEEFLKGGKADFSECCHDDCSFVVPGGPPLPMPVLAEMCGGMMLGFCGWTNKVKIGASIDGDAAIVWTQQRVGVMSGDNVPAMGPFPAISKASLTAKGQAAAAQALILPWEKGTYVFEEREGKGYKLAKAFYEGQFEDKDKDATTLHLPAGMQVGFPCIFAFLDVPWTPPPPPPVDMLMACEVADFSAWRESFEAHAKSKTFPYKGTTHTVSMARGECLNADKEEVFRDMEDGNKIVVPFFEVDMPKMGALMSEPAFIEGIKDSVVSQDAPMIMEDPPKPGSGPKITPAVFFSYPVKDVAVWSAGFKAHGKTKRGTWYNGTSNKTEAKYARSEFCDEKRTRMFQSLKDPSRVGGLIYDVDGKKMGEFLNDPSFGPINEFLGVLAPPQLKVLSAMLPPPGAAGA